jgi:hypothetical protein
MISVTLKINGEQNFQSHFWYPSQYSDWAMGAEFFFLAGAELFLFFTAFRLFCGSSSVLSVVYKGYVRGDKTAVM